LLLVQITNIMSPRAINLAEKESEVLAYLLPLLLFLQQQQRRLSSGMARTSSRSSGQHQPQMAAPQYPNISSTSGLSTMRHTSKSIQVSQKPSASLLSSFRLS